MKNTFKNLLIMVLAVIMTVSMAVPASAASNVDPYVHNWFDSALNGWHVQYYEQDQNDGKMAIKDRVFIEGSKVYDMVGNLIMNDLAPFTEDKPTVAINGDGIYFVSNAGELRYMKASYDATYATNSTKTNYLGLDLDDLAKYAETDLRSVKLSSLEFKGSYQRHTDPVVERGAYVIMESNGDAEKIAHKAFSNGKLFLTTYTRAANVWQNDVSKLLTDKCKGGKFAGYSRQYAIYLATLAGSVYRFDCGERFETPHLVVENVKVYKFVKDQNGFVTSILTSNGTVDIGGNVTNPTLPSAPSNGGGNNNGGNGNNGGSTGTETVTSCRVFLDKTLAMNDATLVGTLITGTTLSWKGTELANSKGYSDAGVTKSGTPVWIVSGTVYVYRNGSVEQLVSNAELIRYDDANRAESIRTTGGKTISIEG